MKLIGPFKQLLTMDHLPKSGPIADDQLEIIPDAGIRHHDGRIFEIGSFKKLLEHGDDVTTILFDAVAFPGWIDAHTHICFAGNRCGDYAQRVAGVPYQEIAKKGGGILDTVNKTRKATQQELEDQLTNRVRQMAKLGVTTCEVKSGYGLTIHDEIKMLTAIANVNKTQSVNLIATCLAAHVKPIEYFSNADYLKFLIDELFPLLQNQKLSNRIDIFADDGAFNIEEAKKYLIDAKKLGFSICIHADQFSRGGSKLAADVGALSADHLEQTTIEDARLLQKAGVIPVVLPGATLGLGMPFPPARMLLDANLPLVIASDWNPGSAPMGNLILQAAVLGAAQKLTLAETYAAMTTRAAAALELDDRGRLAKGLRADFTVYQTSDYRDILYHQGSLTPSQVFVHGTCIYE